MPALDQTGPVGYGPGTGRGMGPCGRGMAMGRGFGRRFGRGRGFCRDYYPGSEPLGTEAQKQLLEAELKRIEAEKAEIERRLTTIE